MEYLQFIAVQFEGLGEVNLGYLRPSCITSAKNIKNDSSENHLAGILFNRILETVMVDCVLQFHSIHYFHPYKDGSDCV